MIRSLQILYISVATRPLTAYDLQSILRASRRNNARLGVTGLLLLRGDLFVQLLEGTEPALDRLIAKIDRDDRHKDLEILLREPADQRIFPRWQMGHIPDTELAVRLPEILPHLDALRSGAAGDQRRAILDALRLFSARESLATKLAAS